jgi:2-oxoglutarate ferredoxin oxidoreductase subunit alpha
VEDSQAVIKMNDKRLKKMKEIEEEIKKFNPAAVYGKGKNLIIGWGSTKGAIIDSLLCLSDFRFLQISYLSPFPKDIVKDEIKKSKRVVLVENDATGLLGDIVAEQTGCEIKEKVLKYDGRPFIPKDIIDGIK